MIIGKYYVLDETFNIVFKDGKYYEENVKTFELTERSIVNMALLVSMYWSKSLSVQKENDVYKAIISLPIYDGVELELFGYGKSEEEASNDVNALFDSFLKCYEEFKRNEKRNENNFMSEVKKFAYFFKDRNTSCLMSNTFDNLELICEDSATLTSFREFAIKNGIPNDARADNPIFGYVKDNTIVFYKPIFVVGQKEKFKDFVKAHYNEIAKHYNLKNYNVYTNAIRTIDNLMENNECYPIEFLSMDYSYYTPIEQII